MSSGAAAENPRMLREVKNGTWTVAGVWFWRRYVFCAGSVGHERGVRPAEYARMAAAQADGAVCVLTAERRSYWWASDRFYWEHDGLAAEDVRALVYERTRRAQRRLERAHAVLAQDAAVPARREPVPRDVRRAVFERDGGACVECGATFDLQYDHVIPVSMGGASTVGNLQILCAPCNQAKGAAL